MEDSTNAPDGAVPGGAPDAREGEPASLRADLNAVVDEVSALFHEREEETRMITTGILAGQHTLLLGPPGTAKSALARELTSRIVSASYWEILLHKFVAPSEIFGPIDLAALTNGGAVRQILDGFAAQANIVFLDEIFKCSSAALNSMLTFLNERIYHPVSGGVHVCPLISAVCASNELAEDETTAALYDRLMIRMEVDYLAEPDSFELLMRSTVKSPNRQNDQKSRTVVELTDLWHAITTEVPAVDLPVSVIAAIRDLRSDLKQREIGVSDRSWKQTGRVLQAAAWLAGRDAVSVDDLAVLTHMLWDVPANRATVDRVVRGYLSPDDRDLANLVDSVDRIAAELDKLVAEDNSGRLHDWAMDQNVALATIAKKLGKIRDAAQAAGLVPRPYQQACDRAQYVYSQLLSQALGVAADKVPNLFGGAR